MLNSKFKRWQQKQIVIMARRHKLTHWQAYDRYMRGMRIAMERVYGWCGAEDGVYEQYSGAYRFRYGSLLARRKSRRIRATRIKEWTTILAPHWTGTADDLRRTVESVA